MQIQTGPLLFQFDSKQEWINKAQRIWKKNLVRAEETILIDSHGRVCRIGKDFMSAETDNAYPIKVYLAREDMGAEMERRREFRAEPTP